jgi:hypothetical protein
LKEEEIVALYNSQYHINLDPKEIVEAKHLYFWRHILGVSPIEEVVDVVHRYRAFLPMAIVSGGTRRTIHQELQFTGIHNFFQMIRFLIIQY